MARSIRALLLAAACCVVLVGCPRVHSVNGPVYMKKMLWGWTPPLQPGMELRDGALLDVHPGSSITVEYGDGCFRTYGPGEHTLINEEQCEREDRDEDQDQQDEDQDQDQDQQEPEQQQDQPQDGQPDPSTESQGPGDSATTSTSTQPSGVVDTVTSFVTSTTGGVITGLVAGGLLYEHIEDNREEDKTPISP